MRLKTEENDRNLDQIRQKNQEISAFKVQMKAYEECKQRLSVKEDQCDRLSRALEDKLREI